MYSPALYIFISFYIFTILSLNYIFIIDFLSIFIVYNFWWLFICLSGSQHIWLIFSISIYLFTDSLALCIVYPKFNDWLNGFRSIACWNSRPLFYSKSGDEWIKRVPTSCPLYCVQRDPKIKKNARNKLYSCAEDGSVKAFKSPF